jgi:RNA polymerase sigma-70 factor (ECF subfamily)
MECSHRAVRGRLTVTSVPQPSMLSMVSLPQYASAMLRWLPRRWTEGRLGKPLPDLHLVDEARRGNPAAYGELIDRYQERLYNLVRGMIAHRDEALEVTQEVFVRAYQELDQVSARSTWYAWLCRVAVNACLEVRRADRRTSRLFSLAEERRAGAGNERGDPPSNADPDPASAAGEREARLCQAIEMLPEPVRTAIVLRDIAGLTPQEIAEIMACPLETVKARVQQGRAELRGKLVSSADASPTLCKPGPPEKS